MSLHRDILYRNYSAAFSAQKTYAPEAQFAQYEATYRNLPGDRATAIADLGCGKGEWLAWMAGKGFRQLTGVDGSESDLFIARSHDQTGAHWVQAELIEHLEAHPGSYDLLHAKDVIEHMTKEEFIRFLLAAHQALRPGGQLWLLTFNAQSPLSAATRYGDFTHESGHTPASLAQCLRACGFAQPRVRGLHYCSASVSGRLRAAAGAVLYRLCRFVLKVRHGGGGHAEGVDLYTALPDLFATAQKA
ncbi:MAG: class I SAM-dependent methyltransferase [Prosthecobacter sp.]|jgi:cyclopropane fatty-acyl-phospholipid synthase-like methyltransferase|nr:class I SAM-dependent methyltransferase [Prosthecobacter sp.]